MYQVRDDSTCSLKHILIRGFDVLQQPEQHETRGIYLAIMPRCILVTTRFLKWFSLLIHVDRSVAQEANGSTVDGDACQAEVVVKIDNQSDAFSTIVTVRNHI